MTSPLEQAAAKLGATPSDMPGLWSAPGYPELTSWQLLDAACRHDQGAGMMQSIASMIFR